MRRIDDAITTSCEARVVFIRCHGREGDSSSISQVGCGSNEQKLNAFVRVLGATRTHLVCCFPGGSAYEQQHEHNTAETFHRCELQCMKRSGERAKIIAVTHIDF